MKKTLFLSLLLSSVTIFGAEENSVCSSSTIKKVVVPVSYAEESYSDSFELKFNYQGGTSDKTIIYLGGGPAATVGRDIYSLYNISSDFNLVSLDYRGVGCNNFSKLQVDRYGREIFNRNYFAQDLVKIIKNLKLKPKSYIIWAHSYGTTVAPELSTLIDHYQLPEPAAIFMLGTVENTDTIKHLGCDEECRFIQQFKKLLNSLPANEREYYLTLFSAGTSGFPDFLDVSGIFWKNTIWSSLANGGQANVLKLLSRLHYALRNPGSDDTKELKEWALSLQKRYEAKYEIPVSNITSDMYPDSAVSWYVLKSELNWGSQSLYPNYEHIFDSTQTNLKHSAIYIHGSADFLTPIEMAQNSFKHQQNVENKIFVTMDTGHSFVPATHLACLNSVMVELFKGVQVSMKNYASLFKSCAVSKIEDKLTP